MCVNNLPSVALDSGKARIGALTLIRVDFKLLSESDSAGRNLA